MSDALPTQGFKLEVGDVGDSPAALTEISEITNFSGFDGQAAIIDVTHLQSTAKEKLQGLQDNGGFSLDVNHLPSDAGQKECRAAKAAGGKKLFLLTYSDTSTVQFEAFVMSNPQSGGVDSKVDGSFALEITGALTITEA